MAAKVSHQIATGIDHAQIGDAHGADLVEADRRAVGADPVELGAGPVTVGGDRLVTQVISLKYESAAQLVNVLRPLITPNNTIAAFPNTNALIITDYAENLRRIVLGEAVGTLVEG